MILAHWSWISFFGGVGFTLSAVYIYAALTVSKMADERAAQMWEERRQERRFGGRSS